MNLKSYFDLLRIKDWRGYFLIASFGFVISKGFLFSLREIVIFYSIVFLLLSFGFAINDCFDTKEDKLNKDKENPIALKKISFRKGFGFSIFLAILGLFLSIQFGLKAFLLVLTSIFLTLFYSAPPLRMKSRFLLDLFSHGLFAGAFLFLIPVLVFGESLTSFHYLVAFSLFYFSITLELRNHTEDYVSDKKAGLRTTVCVLGLKNSEKLLRYLALFYPLTLFPVFFFIFPEYLSLFFTFTLIFIFLFLFKRNSRIIKNYKIIDLYANLSFLLLAIATIF